jgi:Cu/Zn superoxide dismutase
MKQWIAGLVAVVGASFVQASLVIPVHLTDAQGVGKTVGIVTADDSIYGLLLTPNLRDLPPGVHGFHIHELPMCDHKGTAAGAHFDPDHSAAHLGPYSHGHLGDLPVLIVGLNGRASLPLLAPRLKLSDIAGRALMIHVGADNYSDTPEKLGGGGARLACGVIPYY